MQQTQALFLYAVVGGLLVLSFFVLRPFLISLSLAAIAASVLFPVYKRMPRRSAMARNFSAFAVVLLGLACILIPLFFAGTRILAEAQNLYGVLSGGSGAAFLSSAVATVRVWFEQATGSAIAPDVSTGLVAYAEQTATWLVQNLGKVFSSTVSLVADIFVFCMALFFLLRDGESLKRALVALSPLPDAADELVFRRLEQAVGSVVRGNLLVAVVQGCLTGIGFAVFGLGSAVLWGAMAAVAALVPFVGAALVWIPGALFLFVTGHSAAAIGLALWGTLAVGLSDNLLRPFLMSSAHMHPLLVFLFVIGGIGFFGPAGIFLGPLCLSLLSAFLSVYAESRKPVAGAELPR